MVSEVFMAIGTDDELSGGRVGVGVATVDTACPSDSDSIPRIQSISAPPAALDSRLYILLPTATRLPRCLLCSDRID